MLSLPHGRVLLAIGWVLIALIVVGSLIPVSPMLRIGGPDVIRHFAGYFILMLYFAGLYPRERHIMLAFAFFLMGVALEVLQDAVTVTRDMDVRDVFMNTFGIAVAFLLARFGLGEWARRIDRQR